MEITSTEFQQNVGYYLKEAQAGKELLISRSKPSKAVFKLVLLSEAKSVKPKRKFTMQQINAMLNKYGVSHGKESGLEFQRRVRS